MLQRVLDMGLGVLDQIDDAECAVAEPLADAISVQEFARVMPLPLSRWNDFSHGNHPFPRVSKPRMHMD